MADLTRRPKRTAVRGGRRQVQRAKAWQVRGRFPSEPDEVEPQDAAEYQWWLLERDFFGSPFHRASHPIG